MKYGVRSFKVIPAAVPHHSRRGFALIIALLMMGMMVLLLLALGTLSQVELASGDNDRLQQAARHNAKLGMNEALALLQKYAGPDQRATAAAGIVLTEAQLSEPSVERYWTGVWNGDPQAGGSDFEQGKEPVWLVSAQSDATPISPELSHPVVLYGAANDKAALRVRADLLPLDGVGGASGGYAFWVADEGVKVNMLTIEPEAYRDLDPVEADWLKRLRLPHSSDWGALVGGDPELTINETGRLTQLSQMGLVLNATQAATISDHFHDLTLFSRSVLANTAEGGLRKDLTRILGSDGGSIPGYASTETIYLGGPRWGFLRSFEALRETLAEKDSLTAGMPVQSPSASRMGLYPLVSMIQFGISADIAPTPLVPSVPGDPKWQVRIILQPVVTLVNPYNFPLEADTYTLKVKIPMVAGDGFGMRLQLYYGRAALTGTAQQQTDTADSLTAFDDIFGKNEGLQLQMKAVAFAPGEAKVFSLGNTVEYMPDSTVLELVPGIHMLDYAWLNAPGDSNQLTDTERLSLPAGKIRVRTRWGYVVFDLYAASVSAALQKAEGIIYSSTANYLSSPDIPGDNPVPFRIALRDTWHRGMTVLPAYDTTNGARWLADYNLRAPISGEIVQNGNRILNPLYDSIRSVPTASPVPSVDLTGGNNFTNAYWGSDISGVNGQETFVPLFDIPRQPLVSIASLQHAQVQNSVWGPAYPIGNSLASPHSAAGDKDISYALNEALWDGYFFSSLPATATTLPTPALPLLNSRLETTEDATLAGLKEYDTAAANLLLRGGFNVNSVSVDAWRALLRGLRGKDRMYYDVLATTGNKIRAEGGSDGTELRTTFARADLPGGDSGEAYRGFRSFSDNQIDELATAIVTEVRARGPFLTLAQFVNRDITAAAGSNENLKGALQAAIDATDINDALALPVVNSPDYLTYPAAATGPRATATPGYLMQADLLQSIGSVLAVRSDTFLIRAYGCAFTLPGQMGNVAAEAWCEAVVQRLPQYMDTTNAPEEHQNLESVNENLGRRFRIIGFRWLSADEI